MEMESEGGLCLPSTCKQSKYEGCESSIMAFFSPLLLYLSNYITKLDSLESWIELRNSFWYDIGGNGGVGNYENVNPLTWY